MILLTSESKSKPERGICEQLVELCGPTGKVQREAARGRGRTAGDPLRDAGSLGGTSEAKPGNLGLCGKIKENNVTCWLRVKAPAAFGQEVRGEPPASSPQGCTQGPQEGFGLSRRGRGGRRHAGAAAGATVGGVRGAQGGHHRWLLSAAQGPRAVEAPSGSGNRSRKSCAFAGIWKQAAPRCSLQELRKAQSGSASWGQSIFVQRLVLCSHEGVQPADPTGETPTGETPLKQHHQEPACAGLGTRQALMVLS